VRHRGGRQGRYNWGYDPYHWMAPEGSYASSVRTADGGSRVAEFRTMVGGLHRDGLRVVLDQVFNHTPASGQADTSVLDRIVPGYYQRLDAAGAVQTSTCCQNVATEHAMGQKIMVDSVVSWARSYHVTGSASTSWGTTARANMLALRAALDRLTPARDGVDGASVYLYGEGWNFGEVADNALFTQATQGNLGGHGIGTFSDRCVTPCAVVARSTRTPASRASAAASPPTPTARRSTTALRLAGATTPTWSSSGLAGNLKAFTFKDSSGKTVRGDQVDYNGAPAGYADQPDEVVSYVDAHDNETIWDSLTYKLPVSTSMPDRVRMNTDVAGHHRAGPDAVVLARGGRPAAQQEPGPQQLRQRRLVQPAGLDRRRQRVRPRPAARGRQRRQVALHEAAAGQPALKPTAPTCSRLGQAARSCCGCATPRRCSGWAPRRTSRPRSASPSRGRPTPTRGGGDAGGRHRRSRTPTRR
jgi:hypothetical protein